MKVKALDKGWYKGFKQPGQVFEYDGITEKTVDGKKVAYFPSWMEKVDKPAKQVPKHSQAEE